MESYKPSRNPNPEEWLDLEEEERISLIREFHDCQEDDLPDDAKEMHSVLHAIVENQLVLEVEPVPGTIAKLTRQGLDRHEAIHAIGAILCEDIFDLMKGNTGEFSPKKYRRKLEKLTAKRWRKGQY